MINTKVNERIFNLLILIFFATPFLFVLYGQMQGNIKGFNIEEMLTNNPYLNVMFITSFLTPFIGFYLLHIKKQLKDKGLIELVLGNLLLIGISFIFLQNLTFALFIFILFYFIFLNSNLRVKELFKYPYFTKTSLKEMLGSFVILILSIIVRYMFSLVAGI